MKEIIQVITVFSLLNLTLGCVFFQGPNGLLQGRLVPIPDANRSFYAFQEMPYAQPPIGDLRFEPPQEVSNWTGVRDASRNTKVCHQIGYSAPQLTEDCLYLNVYTPQLPNGKNKEGLPVMVYFHGGGFIIGHGGYLALGPHYLIKYDVVIVTLNYRLGVYGFLSTQDEVIPGNNGLKDQLLALQWVNQHIRFFGGDPNKVTIFGHSAGAASVGYHLLNPKSKGLYRGAILQSGTPLSPWAYQREAKSFAYKLASKMKADVKTSEELLDFLKIANVDDINKATEEIAKEEKYDNQQILQGYYFSPTLEPESSNAFLTEKMYEVLADGKANNVPIMIGFTSEEFLLFINSIDSLKTTLMEFDNDLSALIPKGMNVDPTRTNELGEIIRSSYVLGKNLLEENLGSGVKYSSDTAFTRSIIMHATLQSQFSDVFLYEFDYDGVLGNITLKIEGADFVGHSEELPYLWKTSCEVSLSEEDSKTREHLTLLWTNFAKTMDPNAVLLDTSWLTFNNNTKAFLSIKNLLSIDYNPKESTFSAWSDAFYEYGNRPFDTC